MRGRAAFGTICTVALAVSACGGSSSTATGGSSGTVKVGVLTTLSGPSASAFADTVSGVKARFAAYKQDGGRCAGTNFDVVTADDTSTPQGALAATQKLEQQDKVYSLLEISPFFFGAAQFATTAGKATPVIGGAFDGSKQWADTTNNLLPASAVPDFTTPYTTTGTYFKSVGGTRIAGIAYNNASAQGALDVTLKSAEAAGLTRGYVNTSVPFGSTDVGAIVLGIIASKADVIDMTINPDTSFAIVAGLHQAGYHPKAILSATGYGADLLKSPAAVQAGQDVTFSVGWAPSELQNAGTVRMGKALKEFAGSASGIPGFGQTVGWFTADLFLHGLDLAGCNTSQTKLLSTIRTDRTWTANGLYPSPRNFTTIATDKLCLYFLRLKGTAFVPEPNAMPICGGPVS
jgi:branched-chain amino acid transport system substrate-binding protein